MTTWRTDLELVDAALAPLWPPKLGALEVRVSQRWKRQLSVKVASLVRKARKAAPASEPVATVPVSLPTVRDETEQQWAERELEALRHRKRLKRKHHAK